MNLCDLSACVCCQTFSHVIHSIWMQEITLYFYYGRRSTEFDYKIDGVVVLVGENYTRPVHQRNQLKRHSAPPASVWLLTMCSKFIRESRERSSCAVSHGGHWLRHTPKPEFNPNIISFQCSIFVLIPSGIRTIRSACLSHTRKWSDSCMSENCTVFRKNWSCNVIVFNARWEFRCYDKWLEIIRFFFLLKGYNGSIHIRRNIGVNSIGRAEGSYLESFQRILQTARQKGRSMAANKQWTRKQIYCRRIKKKMDRTSQLFQQICGWRRLALLERDAFFEMCQWKCFGKSTSTLQEPSSARTFLKFWLILGISILFSLVMNRTHQPDRDLQKDEKQLLDPWS